MANRTKRTPGKRQIILDAISQGLTIAEAAHAAGMVRNTIAEWRRDDVEFAAAFEQAYADGTDAWEAKGRQRAWDGDTSLYIFLMKSRDPHRFNRRMIGIGQDENADPVNVNATAKVLIYPRADREDEK